MKKILFLFSFLSSVCYGQNASIKLNEPKTFVIVQPIPGVTTVADSIYISEIRDDGVSVSVTVKFYDTKQPDSKPAMIAPPTLILVVWSGPEYEANKNYTKAQLKARIKDLLL